MDATDALEFRLSCTPVEPNRCQGCGTETQFLLCNHCLTSGKTPTYKIEHCVSCGKTMRSRWEEPGKVTCGQLSCYVEAVDRMASYLIADTRRGINEEIGITGIRPSSDSEGLVRYPSKSDLAETSRGSQLQGRAD